MRFTWGALWMGLLLITGCQQNYKIEGESSQIPNGTTIWLQKQVDDKFVIIDSTTIQNGRFHFEGVQDNAAIAILVPHNDIQSTYPPLLLALEPGKIKVTLDSLSRVSGTPLNNRLQRYESLRDQYDSRLHDITKSYVANYLDGTLTDSVFNNLKERFKKVRKRLETLTRNYILANTDNITSVYLFLQNSFLFSPEEQRRLIAEADPAFAQNPAVQRIGKLLEAQQWVERGDSFIDLTLQTPEGKRVALSQYVGKGRYILLDFWASWSAPCREQMPYLQQLYERYGNKRFSIVGISFDTDPKVWKEYIDENQIEWPQLSDLKGWDSPAITQYAIQGIPHLILIDPNGKIAANNPDEEELNLIISSQIE